MVHEIRKYLDSEFFDVAWYIGGQNCKFGVIVINFPPKPKHAMVEIGFTYFPMGLIPVLGKVAPSDVFGLLRNSGGACPLLP